MGRGDHVLDRPDLRERQARRRYAGTGRLILGRTGVLAPAPGMEPAGRQLEKSQHRSQGKILAGAIHGAQDAPLGAPVRQTRACKPKPRGSEQGEHEPEQCRELVDASPELQNFLSELRLREVRNLQTHHDRRRQTEPAARRRAWNAEVGGGGHVAGALDEMPKAVIIALLPAGRSRHGNDHRPISLATQLEDDVESEPT